MGYRMAGDGMAGMLETNNDTMIGGCYDCENKSKIERPRIGQELKELMLKQFS